MMGCHLVGLPLGTETLCSFDDEAEVSPIGQVWLIDFDPYTYGPQIAIELAIIEGAEFYPDGLFPLGDTP